MKVNVPLFLRILLNFCLSIIDNVEFNSSFVGFILFCNSSPNKIIDFVFFWPLFSKKDFFTWKEDFIPFSNSFSFIIWYRCSALGKYFNSTFFIAKNLFWFFVFRNLPESKRICSSCYTWAWWRKRRRYILKTKINLYHYLHQLHKKVFGRKKSS